MSETPGLGDVIAGRLPWRIDRADWIEPTLVLGGSDFTFSLTCPWRVVGVEDLVMSWLLDDIEDRVSDLVGHDIMLVDLAADPHGDPRLGLSGGLVLEVFSDTDLDPWVLDSGQDIVIVGESDPATGMPPATNDRPGVAAGLPWRIKDARWEGSVLALGGPRFALDVRCSWRVLTPGGIAYSSSFRPNDLPAALARSDVMWVAGLDGVDPEFGLSGDRALQVFTDTSSDAKPWALRASGTTFGHGPQP